MNYLQKIWIKIALVYHTLTTKYKNLTIIVLVAIILGILFFGRKNPDPVSVLGQTEPILQKAKILKDINDKNSAVITQLVVSDKRDRARIADSVAKVYELKIKQIQGIDKYVYVKDTVFITKSTPIFRGSILDSNRNIIGYKVETHDPWIDIVAVAGKDTASIAFSSRDTLLRTEVVKNPLFGAPKRTVIIRNTNPYNSLQSGYSWTTKDKKTFIAIGPAFVWNPITNKFSVGVGISLPLIQIKR